jgi:hypothetical protein
LATHDDFADPFDRVGRAWSLGGLGHVGSPWGDLRWGIPENARGVETTSKNYGGKRVLVNLIGERSLPLMVRKSERIRLKNPGSPWHCWEGASAVLLGERFAAFEVELS